VADPNWPTNTWYAEVGNVAANDEFVEVINQAGRLRVAGAGSDFARVQLMDMPRVADVEMLMKVTFSSTSDEGRLRVVLRGDGKWSERGAPVNGYTLSVSGGGTFSVNVYESDALFGVQTGSHSLGVGPFWIRYQVNGSQIRARAWPVDDTEPSTWTLAGNDTRITDPGVMEMTYFIWGTGPQDVQIDDIQVFTSPLTP
jgi:hypothetical protein